MGELRTWSIPSEPKDIDRVRDQHGDVWTYDDGAWRYRTSVLTWRGLVVEHGPLTEVIETEIEAAARRLRESEFNKRGMVRLSRDYTNAAQDIHAVLVHVLNGGVL